MIIRSPPNRQRNVSHHGKENCRCIESSLNELNIGEKVSFKKQKKGNKFTLLI